MREMKGRRIRQVFDRNAIGEGERSVVYAGDLAQVGFFKRGIG